MLTLPGEQVEGGMDWRKVEAVLIELCRLNSIDITDDAGNLMIGCEDIEGDTVDVSITELAKELAEALK